MIDLTTGLGFITKLTNIPPEYKTRIDYIYQKANDGRLTSDEINEATSFFRTECHKQINVNSDKANFANAFMMLTIALDDYKLLKEKDWERKDKAYKRAQARKLKN